MVAPAQRPTKGGFHKVIALRKNRYDLAGHGRFFLLSTICNTSAAKAIANTSAGHVTINLTPFTGE
ncbi:MAG: hypothetical protein K6T83_14405 [Alicyclobacillus sp.]|nr:hypothetical protein [Alicyclobacillus sp.]